MISFKKWLKINEAEGVVTKKDCNNPDFQVWGAFCKKNKSKKWQKK